MFLHLCTIIRGFFNQTWHFASLPVLTVHTCFQVSITVVVTTIGIYYCTYLVYSVGRAMLFTDVVVNAIVTDTWKLSEVTYLDKESPDDGT